MKTKQLIFVYNADSGLFNLLTDFSHKILSPSTYQCKLCVLTYGDFSMKNEWKNFIETLPVKTVFVYKNDFLKQYKVDAAFPAVFFKEDDRLIPFLSKEEIEHCQSLAELKSLVLLNLAKHDQHHHTNL